MLRLWGRTNSSNVMKVVWLLEELGLPYERIDAGGPFGGTTTPDYLAMSPQGLIPALADGDYTLFESNAILRYVCNAHAPSHKFYPAEPRPRGTVDAWLDFQQCSLVSAQNPVFIGLVRTPPERRDNAAISAGVAQAGRLWALVDERLGRQPYIVGQSLTLVDIAFGPHVHRWFNMPLARPDSPHLRAWYDRLLARPAYRAHVALPVT